MKKFQSIALAVAIGAGGSIHAADYEAPELMMRSGAGSAYQIPVGSSWSSKTPSLNNQGQVAMSINVVAPEFNAGVWLGTVDGGEIVDIASGDGDLYTDVDINDEGQIVWTRNESSQDGILMYDPVEDETVYLTNAPVGASGWSSVAINDQQALSYRSAFGFSGNAWVSWDSEGGDEIHVAETGVDSDSPYAFLFTPSLNNDRRIAGKAAINSFNTNQIIIADEDGTIETLVEDSELDPDSPFSNFNNSVGFNDHGQVAFVAQLTAGGSGLFVADSEGWAQYALAGENGVDSFEAFSPVVNNDGLVAFRGFNDSGERAIWLADGETVTAIVTEGDIVDTDLGPARLQSPDEVGGPNFGGTISINDQGQVAFVSLLTDPDSSAVSRGRGVFLVSPEISETPGIGLEKTAEPMIFEAPGDIISYTFIVTNTGNVTLSGPVSVDDDQETVECPSGDLAPDESMTCHAERVISTDDVEAGSVTNIATATADGVESNEASVTVRTPPIFDDRFEVVTD